MPESEPEADLCPRCGGRGWLLEPDEGAGSARACDCRLERQGPRLIERSAIPPRYRGCTLDNFEVHVPKRVQQDQLVEALALSRRYVDEFLQADGTFTESGLLFVGPAGGGKTHLATAVLSELIRRYRVRGRFVDFTALIHQIQATFEPDARGSKAEILRLVNEAEVLVLDDLGAQKISEWVSELIYLVLNGRYNRRLPTLITTNCRLGGSTEVGDGEFRGPMRVPLEDRIQAPILSRIYQMALVVRLEVDDFRKEIKNVSVLSRI